LEKWTLKLLLGGILLFTGVLLPYFIISYFFFGILLITAGLVLLATLPERATDLRKPVGVTAIGVFALFGSMGLSFFSLYTISALTIGGIGGSISPYSGLLFSVFVWHYLPVGVFALSSLFFSIVILRGVSSKHLWYALMTYWILLLGYSLFRDFTTNALGALGSVFSIWLFSTTVYPAVSIAYFLTKKPRQYFHLTTGQPAAQAPI
jgi:hypothetical protein